MTTESTKTFHLRIDGAVLMDVPADGPRRGDDAVTVIVRRNTLGNLNVGIAVCNGSSDQFSRKLGRKIALGRLNKRPLAGNTSDHTLLGVLQELELITSIRAHRVEILKTQVRQLFGNIEEIFEKSDQAKMEREVARAAKAAVVVEPVEKKPASRMDYSRLFGFPWF